MRSARLAVGLIVRCGALRGPTPRRGGFARRAMATTAADDQFDLLAKYQAGDWRGVWTQVTVDDSEATPPRRMRTHIELVEDGTATHHVNTPDGGEPQDYGIHRKGEPHVAKFLPRAFLYGPNLFPAAAKGPPGAFATEVGLRLADARVRVVFVHAGLPLGGGAGLLRFTVIREADGDSNYAVGRRDLWAEWAGPKERGPWQGTIQRYNAEEECWINESVSGGTEEDASWCVENRAKWSASPLKLQARPGAPFASDDYLKHDLDGQIRIAVPTRWAAGDQKSLAVEWAPVGAKKCLVARVEILMDADGAPRMTSFLVEDDEVLELSD